MKIAIVIGQYHRRGGFQRNATQLATGFNRLGHEVTVITQAAETTDDDKGISFVFFKTRVQRPLALSMFVQYLQLTRIVRKLAGDYDAVVSIGTPLLAPIVIVGPGTHRAFFLVTTRMGGSLVRRTFEKIRPFHRVVMWWERAMLKGEYPRLVVVSSPSAISEYTDLYEYPAEKVAVVPYPVESKEFRFSEALRRSTRSALQLDDETKVMLHIGNRGRQKGLDTIVKALNEIQLNEPWSFLFAGAGSESRALRKATRELTRQGRVKLLGRVEDTRALYCASDFLVFPSRFDPWGLVVTEALACGLPVICTAGIGASAAVEDGRNGLLLANPNDPAELARKIEKLAGSLSSYDRLDVAESVKWLDHELQIRQFEKELLRVTESAEAARP